jgi:hypothetical protein
MVQEKKLNLLKVALIIFAIVAIVYGIGYVFFSESLVEMSGGDPVHPSWLRWPGCVLITLGLGAAMVLRNPAKQDIFVTVIALGTLLTGLALLYTLVFEMQEENAVWFTAMPTIIILATSALLWWGRNQAKDVLKQE